MDTGTTIDLTSITERQDTIINNQKDLIFLSSFENVLLFAIIVFLSLDKALGRFLKK